MEAYYDQAGIKIFHGDSREILPQLVGDLVVTDPPYGIEGGSGTINSIRSKGKYCSSFEDSPEYIANVVVPVINGAISRFRCVVVTPGNKNMCHYPCPSSFGVFYQPASVGLQVFGNADAQPIFYYGKNISGKNMGVPCSYVLTEQPQPNGHPCPKPYSIWRKLISNVSLAGHTVIDPFMGSGTTLRAAKDLDMKAIGIEIEEKYCEIAVKRLEQDVFAFW